MTYRLLMVAGLALGLSACGGFSESLGTSKQSPDEFRVVSRAPLTVPPDFQLRPPEPGAPRPQVGTPAQQAERAVFRNDAGVNQTANAAPRRVTVGEQALLSAAGAQEADPNIRQVVNRETKQINEEADYFVDRLIFWNDITPAGTVVDPVAERRRLQENAALGQPSTTGPTPQIERRRKAPLEGIF
ncbi:DUF3035 domain-containing protein [Pelagibius marinus]|uniref:DUF3035 domain-containing protein n=1 Tax=Pelagibius marinus TaxID=2762760 RepID=UPI001D0392A2|nr:DUF3035 domain-containing protein [Pelagibius marinus]